jgi:hypothetical protein
MSIEFKCPHCQASLQAVSEVAGKQGSCPKCNKEITVPEQDASTQSEQKETAKKD